MGKKTEVKLRKGGTVLVELVGLEEGSEPLFIEVEWNSSGKLYVQSNHDMNLRGTMVLYRSQVELNENKFEKARAADLAEYNLSKPGLHLVPTKDIKRKRRA